MNHLSMNNFSSRVWRSQPLNSGHINWRILLVAGVLIYLIGYPVYIYIDSAVTGGISQRGDLKVVDLKAMSTFSLDQETGSTDDIPKRFRELDGKRVMLTGEMWAPTNASGGLGGFQLVYSISKCCFNGPPLIQHFVQARVVDGKQADFHYGLVNVTGTLHVGVIQKEGRIESVYRVDVESVDPVS